MAYVFKQINDVMGQPGAPQKANIFDPGQGQNMPQGDASGMGAQAKTSTEGELTGSQSTGTQQSSEGQPADIKATDQRIVRQNKMGVPDFAKKAQDDVGAAEQNLQNEANSYVQGAKATNYKIDDAGLEKAIGGDADSMSKVRNQLTNQAKQYDAFDPKGNYDVADARTMQTDEGVKSLLRRNAGENYNEGESAFDMMLLNRTPEFNQIRSSLGARQNALTQQLDGYRTSKTDEARTADAANYKAGQDQIRADLGSKSAALLKAQEAEVAKENAARAALRKTGDKAFLSSQSKTALDKLMADYKGSDPAGISKYLGNSGVNAADYLGYAGDVGLEQAIDAGEATRFNAINGLLGNTDAGVWQAGQGFGDRQSFNSAGYSSAVNKAATAKNAAADKKALADIAAYEKSIQGRLGGIDAYRQKQIDAINKDIGGQYSDVYGDGGGVDAAQFNNDGLNWQSFITKDDLKKLNAYQAELGGGYNGKVGSGIGASFDSNAYRAALVKAMNDRRFARDANEVLNAGIDAYNDKTPTVETGYDIPGAAQTMNDNAIDTVQSAGESVKSYAAKRNPFCFPAGMEFTLIDGSYRAIEDLDIDDQLLDGGLVTGLHEGISDEMFYLDGVLVTAYHPVKWKGEWKLVKNVPEAKPVHGEFRVYSVTTENHVMLHKHGGIFGDYEADDVFNIEE